MKRKIILNLAMSIDGYIAEEDGGFDWIKGDSDKSHDTKKQFNFPEFIESVDIIVMGRRAYEDAPKEGMQLFKSKKIYVITHRDLKNKPDNVEVIRGNIVKKILDLKKEKGADIWLYGGAIIADYFIKKDVIDEYIIGLIPIILGKGRKLFLENNPKLELSLKESTIQEGIIISRYIKRL